MSIAERASEASSAEQCGTRHQSWILSIPERAIEALKENLSKLNVIFEIREILVWVEM